MSFIGLGVQEERRMLETIGVSRFEDLLEAVPAGARLDRPLSVPGPLSEIELRRRLGGWARENAADRGISFLGGGLYDHYIPAAVGTLASRSEFATAYIYNPYLNPEGLISALADELQVAYAESAGPNQILKAVTRRLMELHQAGKPVVLCLDEVQAMPIRTLEVLRLITNLETEKRKLIQVVLFGQPELDALLEHPAVRQLKQRITFSYLLLPLNRVAVRAYIRHRLRVAGSRGPELFTDSAVTSLYRAGKGIPRLINILSHKAMMAAYGEGVERIRPRHVQAAIRDTLEAQQTGLRGLAALMPNFHRWLFGTSLSRAGQ